MNAVSPILRSPRARLLILLAVLLGVAGGIYTGSSPVPPPPSPAPSPAELARRARVEQALPAGLGCAEALPYLRGRLASHEGEAAAWTGDSDEEALLAALTALGPPAELALDCAEPPCLLRLPPEDDPLPLQAALVAQGWQSRQIWRGRAGVALDAGRAPLSDAGRVRLRWRLLALAAGLPLEELPASAALEAEVQALGPEGCWRALEPLLDRLEQHEGLPWPWDQVPEEARPSSVQAGLGELLAGGAEELQLIELDCAAYPCVAAIQAESDARMPEALRQRGASPLPGLVVLDLGRAPAPGGGRLWVVALGLAEAPAAHALYGRLRFEDKQQEHFAPPG